MNDYTVILMYPDHDCESYGETWMGTVQGANPTEAVQNARLECIEDNNWDVDDPEAPDPDDYAVVAVIAGSHEDLNPGI